MNTRKEIVSSFYDQVDEDGQLNRTRHGQLECYISPTDTQPKGLRFLRLVQE